MPPKLKKDASAAAGDSGGSVLNRFKATKEPAAAPAPVATGKKSLKAKQALDLDGKGPLHVLDTLKAVRAGEAKWCRKCADLFHPSKSATQQCPQGHPNFTSVKPAPELKAQLEEAEARIVAAATTVQGGARGRGARRRYGPSGRAATRIQCAARRRAARRSAQGLRARRSQAAAEAAVAERDWEGAIGKLAAALAVEGTRDEELTGGLKSALESAESAKAARDAAREAAEKHLAEGEAFAASRVYPSAIVALETGLGLDTQSDDLTGRLKAPLEKAQAGLAEEEAARSEATEHVATAEAALASHDNTGAMAAYEAALALDVVRSHAIPTATTAPTISLIDWLWPQNDESLKKGFQSGLEAARQALADAVEEAHGKLSAGESA